MVQKRDEALSKNQRRAMAALLEQGKEDSARIRVENIIRSDITTELHEILELYCELLLARAGLLEAGGKDCDPGLEEAVMSIMYAAPKTEIKELQQVRVLLGEKFGKDFVLIAMDPDNLENKVSKKVVKKLSVTPPSDELVQGYLEEIAKAYNVNWPPRAAADLGGPPDFLDDDDENPSGGQAQKNLEEPLIATESTEEKAVEARAELTKATPPRSFGPNSPLHVNPPSPSTENIHPKVTLNSIELKPNQKMVDAGIAKKKASETKPKISDGIPDVDELAKRFAALKR
jgi:vacuolar protein sorting-associated protein IST1